MAFQILEIVNSRSENILAKVIHQDHQFPVTIRGDKSQDLIAGKSFQAEIDYDEVVKWKIVEDFSDDQSGLWEEPDGIHLLGRIHNILDYGDGKTIVDVYVQNGPEFFTVSADAIEDLAPDPSDGLEIVVEHLYIYPIS